MRFQTFIAPNLSKAKELVRAELGEDAVIIATRDAPGGGVEIRAAASAKSRESRKAPPVTADDPAPRAERKARLEDPVLNRGGLDQRYAAKHSEETFAALSGDLSRKSSGARPAPDAPPPPEDDEEDRLFKENFRAALAHHGLGDPLMDALADVAKDVDTDDNAEALSEAFREVFDFAPLDAAPTRAIMLVGPTGAGKTSSAAKIAARALVGGGRVTLLSADVGRAGAIEQIKTYADALETEFRPVESPLDVHTLMRSGKLRGAVVLDTPGISPFDSGDLAAVRSLMEAAEAEPVLVLPASGDAAEHREWAMAFQAFRVRRCIITKFDAAKRVGAALGAAHAAGYALAHFSDAAFIADGLRDATPQFLGARLLAEQPGRLKW